MCIYHFSTKLHYICLSSFHGQTRLWILIAQSSLAFQDIDSPRKKQAAMAKATATAGGREGTVPLRHTV